MDRVLLFIFYFATVYARGGISIGRPSRNYNWCFFFTNLLIHDLKYIFALLLYHLWKLITLESDHACSAALLSAVCLAWETRRHCSGHRAVRRVRAERPVRAASRIPWPSAGLYCHLRQPRQRPRPTRVGLVTNVLYRRCQYSRQ